MLYICILRTTSHRSIIKYIQEILTADLAGDLVGGEGDGAQGGHERGAKDVGAHDHDAPHRERQARLRTGAKMFSAPAMSFPESALQN